MWLCFHDEQDGPSGSYQIHAGSFLSSFLLYVKTHTELQLLPIIMLTAQKALPHMSMGFSGHHSDSQQFKENVRLNMSLLV